MRHRALVSMAAYYVVTGTWPLISMRTFEAVTGPKQDRWLVRMVGALALANGCALAVGARREVLSAETIALAVGSAVAFAAIDITYVAKGRIRAVYLADAAAELAFAGAVVLDAR
jgi:hypothetical protein